MQTPISLITEQVKPLLKVKLTILCWFSMTASCACRCMFHTTRQTIIPYRGNTKHILKFLDLTSRKISELYSFQNIIIIPYCWTGGKTWKSIVILVQVQIWQISFFFSSVFLKFASLQCLSVNWKWLVFKYLHMETASPLSYRSDLQSSTPTEFAPQRLMFPSGKVRGNNWCPDCPPR